MFCRRDEKSEKHSCAWKVLEAFLLWSKANGINFEDELYHTTIYFVKNKVSVAQGDGWAVNGVLGQA